LVLVQRLAARPRRLEVNHGLHGVRLRAEQGREVVAEARVDHPLQARVVPVVHVDHAREALQRIGVRDVDAVEVAGIGPGGAQRHVVVDEERDFLSREEAAGHIVAVAVILRVLAVGQHVD
jgi:hypothetical protein